MDIKLLGSSGFAAIAVFALIAQYGGGTQASSLKKHPTILANAPIESLIETAAVNILTQFAVPEITGILNPVGFTRPSWQVLSNALVFEDPYANIDRFVVMLDPGHGGIDPGAEAHNGLLEKELTLDIARRVKLFLSEFKHLEVVLTRNHDHGLSRQSRVNAIKRSQADMVVSLHFNHLPQTDVTLVESYYAGPENIAQSQASLRQASTDANANQGFKKTNHGSEQDLGFTKGSARLAQTLQQRVYSEVSYENPNADNAGVKRETLFVLTRSFTPGVLIELTCLSNVQEAEKLDSDDYRNRLAAALADGIRAYQESLNQMPLDTLSDIGA